jgi:hypothetical protein
MMDFAYTDPELHDWLRWASEWGTTPMFVSKVADAASAACIHDFEMLRPVLVALKRQHPQPPPGPGALDDPELSGWLCWASRGGNVPSFVRTLVEAAIYACTSDYALLRPVLIELKQRHPEGLSLTPGV